MVGGGGGERQKGEYAQQKKKWQTSEPRVRKRGGNVDCSEVQSVSRHVNELSRNIVLFRSPSMATGNCNTRNALQGAKR